MMARKIFLILVALGSASVSFSQLDVSVKIGTTQSFVYERVQDFKHDMHAKAGFQVGATANIVLLKNLQFRPSIQLTQKGFRSYEGDIDGPQYFDRNISRTYLELPADFIYHLPISTKADLLIGAGPMVGFGLFGRANVFYKEIDINGQINTRRSYDDLFKIKPGYKRLDVGADFLTGVQFTKLIITINYNHGLINILNEAVESQMSKNRCFALAIAYIFNRR